MRVLYLYSGKRERPGQIGIDYPDTQFYGLNHLKKYGLAAEYKAFEDCYRIGFLNKFLGFRLKHLLMFFLAKNYDLVFGSSLIYLMPLKKIFKTKTKFILLNIYLNRLLVSHKNNFFKFAPLKFFIKDLNGIVCLSNFQRNYLIKHYNLPKEKVIFVPLGVDIGFHQYVPDDKRQDFILSVGSDDGRDYQTVMEIAKLLPELNFIIVCGYKNTKNLSYIPANVKIFYYISAQELKKLYSQARILLLVTHSDHQMQGADCSGQTVLLDAMASGLPIIATQKTYLADYVKNNQEIIIIDPYQPEQCQEKIKLLLGNQNLRQQLAQAARNKVETNFSSQLMAKNLTNYFKSIYQ